MSDSCITLNTILLYLRYIRAFASSDSCHASSRKSIKNNISWLCVMKNITHDGWVWNFCMIRMRHIYSITLSFTNITGIRFLHLKICFALSLTLQLFLFFFPLRNEIIKPRVGTSSVIRRVG